MAQSLRPLRLALAGDVMLGHNVAERIVARGFVHPWGDVLPCLREARACFSSTRTPGPR